MLIEMAMGRESGILIVALLLYLLMEMVLMDDCFGVYGFGGLFGGCGLGSWRKGPNR